MNVKSVDSMLRQSPITTVMMAACLLLATAVVCSKSLAEPTASTRIDYGMPERLGREVAPVPSAPWSAPDLRGYTSLLKTAEPSPIDPQKADDILSIATHVGDTARQTLTPQ